MGSVSGGNAWVVVDGRPIEGAAAPPHVHTAPASPARHDEREEKGEGPRESSRPANGALTVTSVDASSKPWIRYSAATHKTPGPSIRWRLRRGVSSNGAWPGGALA